MTLRKLIATALVSVLLFTGLGAVFAASAALSYETQYTYTEANNAWLRELIIKEDMLSVSGLSDRCELEPVADYPYTDDADSFAEKVTQVYQLYSLDENMVNAAYLYMMQLGSSIAGDAAASAYSDDYIKAYLLMNGIVWPDGEAADSPETSVAARVLFALMTAENPYKVTRGTKLFDAVTDYASTIAGTDVRLLASLDSDGSFDSFRDYAMAICRYGLRKAGYDVTKDTSDTDVARLMTIMTIRTAGITVDDNAPVEELRDKYVCATVCKTYDVETNPDEFKAAVDGGDLPRYMLKLLGKKNGLAVTDDYDYESAFEFVRDNTHEFDLEYGEFYADVYKYNVRLTYRRDSVWIYPEALAYDNEGSVEIKSDRGPLKHRYYQQIDLDKDSDVTTVTIDVTYNKDGQKANASYAITFYQGVGEAPHDNTFSGVADSVAGAFANVVNQMSDTPGASRILTSLPFELPARVMSITSLLLPNMNTRSSGENFLSKFFGYALSNASRIGSGSIGGVGGLDAYNNSSGNGLSVNFTQAVIPVSVTQQAPPQGEVPITPGDNPAQEVVIDGENNREQPQAATVGALRFDVKTVVIICVAVLVLFFTCIFMFNEIFHLGANKKQPLAGNSRPGMKEKNISRAKGEKMAKKYRSRSDKDPLVRGSGKRKK